MQRQTFRHPLGVLALAVGTGGLLAGALPAPAAAREAALLVRIPDPVASMMVRRGLRGAISRLERSETCRAVLDDFTTASGMPLSEVLGSRGETPRQYMSGLLFLDGTAHPRCRAGHCLAFTGPGWQVVYVCAQVFRWRLAESPSRAELVLIHETLHTLGLGENPPTSRAIQSRVRARCLAGPSRASR